MPIKNSEVYTVKSYFKLSKLFMSSSLGQMFSTTVMLFSDLWPIMHTYFCMVGQMSIEYFYPILICPTMKKELMHKLNL